MADDLAAILLALETDLLASPGRADAVWLDETLADDFVEFGSSGRSYDKAGVIAALTSAPGTPGEARRIAAFTVSRLAPGVALATCEVSPPRSLRSSVWRKDGDRWRLVFHQGTLAAV